jgi:hypothetical protein
MPEFKRFYYSTRLHHWEDEDDKLRRLYFGESARLNELIFGLESYDSASTTMIQKYLRTL